MNMGGPGAGRMWLKHSKYLCFVQSPTFVPNGVPNLLQSAPGGILGALLGRLGATWAASGGSLAYFLSILLRVAFLLDLGVPLPPRIWGRRLEGSTSGVVVKLTFPVKIVENTNENITFRKWWLPGPLGKGELLRGYGSPGSPSPLKGIALRE